MYARREAVAPGGRPGFLDAVQPRLALVEEEIRRVLRDENRLVEDVATHLLQGGGKRIRPALVLLAGEIWQGPAELLIPVAAAAELIHMATLVHDDTMDQAPLRRGVPTVNAVWGVHVAILTGDYLFAKAFSLLAATGDNRAVRVMADVVFQMCTGEIAQHAQAFRPDQTEAEYLHRIDKKTAYFIAECCRLGGLLSGATEAEQEALRDFGYGIGMGFQIVDDILDLTASAQKLGKPIGSDLRCGVITLPVIHALHHSPQRERIAHLIRTRTLGDAEVDEIRHLVERCGGLHHAFRMAERFTEGARRRLDALPPTPAREALREMAAYLVRREY